jgi:hypothetical protein
MSRTKFKDLQYKFICEISDLPYCIPQWYWYDSGMEANRLFPSPLIGVEPMTMLTGHQIPAFRLCVIRSGLRYEVKFPGMRVSNRFHKMSTIVRREFGFKGTPARLLEQLEQWMDARGFPDVKRDKARAEATKTEPTT